MLNEKRRAVLLCNGYAEKPELLALRDDDFLVAVDGGMRYATLLGRLPDVIIGDLDSIDPLALSALEAEGTEMLVFEPQKDFTDLELAVREVVARGFNEILLAFGLGGRLDHTLGNLGLLSFARDLSEALTVYFDDGTTRVYLVKDTLSLDLDPHDIISLIPWRGDVIVEETQHLAYPLSYETLTYGSTRGISNVALAKTILVSVAKGELLLVHTRKQ